MATLLWNQPEHLELYFAVPLMGAVIHTLNPRLHPRRARFIVDDAEDQAIVVDEIAARRRSSRSATPTTSST